MGSNGWASARGRARLNRPLKVSGVVVPCFQFEADTPEGFIHADAFLARRLAKPGMGERLSSARKKREERFSKLEKYKPTLAGFRRAAGLSQHQLAERVGTSQPVISMYEAGDREPGLRVICALAEALGVSFNDLIPALTNV